jgi:CHAD domain-containing protein
MSITPERCRLVFQKLERDLDRLCAQPEAKRVHRFRTGVRRLQTLLEELCPARDRNQKRLLKLLTRIRKKAGKVRDLDVQLAALQSLKFPQEPRRKTQLMHQLIELRGQREKKLSKALTREAVREIHRRLKRARKDFNPDVNRDPLAVARQILEPIAKADGFPTEELMHQYRLLGKRARYAAEFASKSPESAQFIAQIERLQDALGDWHDWLTLTQSAAKRLGDVRESSLVAALHNVTGAKFRNAVTSLSASHVAFPAARAPQTGQGGTRKRQSRTSAPAASEPAASAPTAA